MTDEEVRALGAILVGHLDDPWFKGLMGIYAGRAETLAKKILHSKEETAFEKGEFAALEWVLARPHEIIKRAEALEQVDSSKPKEE